MAPRAVLLVCVAAATLTAASAAQPRRPAQPTFVASYDIVLTGGTNRLRTLDNQSSDPKSHIVSVSEDSYSGRGILSLKQEANGRLVPASNSFAYQGATWNLSGQNGDQGSFSCSPPIETTNGTVDATGWVVGGVLYVRLSLKGTHEHNDDYDCGANYTGFATDSNYEADSLDQVMDAQPGGWIVTNADHPSVGTLSDVKLTGTAPNTRRETAKWTISIKKRPGSKKEPGPPGPSTSPGPTKGSSRVCTINGTRRNDTLVGTTGDDVICAFGGNDRIDGRGGGDLIYGGPGKDTIAARDKEVDRIDGGPGKDKGTFDASPRDKVVRVERPAFG